MSTMLRPKGKATKLAYAILGKPENLKKPSKKQRKINQELTFEETSRAR